MKETNKNEIIKIIEILKVSYPYYFKDMTKVDYKTLIDVYDFHFKNCDIKELTRVVLNLTATEEYMPTIAKIKKEMLGEKKIAIPKAEEAWQKVIDKVRKYGSYNEEKAMSELTELERYATEAIGYQFICRSTTADNQWNRKDFISIYNSEKERFINNLAIAGTNQVLIGEKNE